MTIDVHHVVEGPSDGPVVVLSHPLGTTSEIWEPQLPILTERFRLVRYDHRGHGHSPVPAGPYAIGDLGADLLRLLDRLRIERASLCGLSLGAMTVLWVAANAPDRVERLVAGCTLARQASPAAWAERAATVRRDGVAAVADLVVERWGYRDGDPRIQALVRRLLLATPAEGYAACCDAIETMDLEPMLGAVRAPTLLLAGADDPAARPAGMRLLSEAIGASSVRLTVIDGAAHLANVEQPAAVNQAIAEHLAPLLTSNRGGGT